MRISDWSSDVCSSDLRIRRRRYAHVDGSEPSNSACFVVIMRIDHWKIGNSLADRHDQERQQSKPRPVTTIRVQVRPHYLQGGDIDFLAISEMWNMALGCSHVLSDSPARSDERRVGKEGVGT